MYVTSHISLSLSLSLTGFFAMHYDDDVDGHRQKEPLFIVIIKRERRERGERERRDGRRMEA